MTFTSFQIQTAIPLDKARARDYNLGMRTFREYQEARTAAALGRWRYVAHLAETMNAPEIAKLLGVSRQRVYQIVKLAQAASRNGASS